MGVVTEATATDRLVEEARAIPIEEAAKRLGLTFYRGREEHPQPCPACGGRDTFSFNTRKNKWNCRRGGVGGGDAIGLAAHVSGLDLQERQEFLQACALASGQEMPPRGWTTCAQKQVPRAKQVFNNTVHAENGTERAANSLRARERTKARDKWRKAKRLAVGSFVEAYLASRSGPGPLPLAARVIHAEPYWHGNDDAGRPIAIHKGPAMVFPFVAANGDITGCHLTWIDPTNPPKYRPDLVDPDGGAALTCKKMRGTKSGALIPLYGFSVFEDDRILPDERRCRWLGGEGIETVRSVALAEALRDDTVYFAAGDLGNLAGPADPTSGFDHPFLKRPGRAGQIRAVRVPGARPRPDQGPADALQVPEHVTDLVLLADGDSDLVTTAAAMARAKVRFDRPGRRVTVVWPPDGNDFADIMIFRNVGELAD